MTNDINPTPNKANGKVMLGAILLLVGCYLLLNQLNVVFFPHWLKIWPLWLVFVGLYLGAKHNYKRASWLILTSLGVIFLLTENIDNAGGFVWPAAIIGLGIWIITRKKHTADLSSTDYWDRKYQADFGTTEKPLADFSNPEADQTGTVPPAEPLSSGSTPPPSYDDILDATAIFGGVNKTILSKNFRGGDITNVFGGTELDFTHADIQGRAIIDLTQVFGGTKLIIPSNWQVVSDVSAIFAGTDDKRMRNPQIKTDKVLVLKGLSLFAGIEIRSF